MNSLRSLFACTMLLLFLTVAGAAQKPVLPKFKKGEAYSSVRTKLIKAGFEPYRHPDADQCMDGDDRCEGRPEMQACAGTGMANCRFLWKKDGHVLVIFTIGEDTTYNGHSFENEDVS